MKKFLSILGIGLLVIITIVLVKTFTNSPGAHQKSTPLEAIPTNAITHMSEAIQLQTETPNDAYEFDGYLFCLSKIYGKVLSTHS